MAETPSTPRLPFNPPQAPPPAPVRTGGPGKPLVLGCLILLILAGAGLIVGIYYAGQHYDQLFAWSLSRVHDSIETRLPADLPAADRQRLEAAFTAAQSAAASIRRNPTAAPQLQSLMLELASTTQGTEPLTRKQVEEITATLEKIAAIGREGARPGLS